MTTTEYTSTYKPVLSHGVWEGVSKDKVFDGCVKAMHITGYMILAADDNTGLISTDWTEFRIERMPPFVIGRYRLNFLLFESAQNAVTVSVKINADWRFEVPAPDYTHDPRFVMAMQEQINNKVSIDIQGLFMEFERLIGTPSSTGHMQISWKKY